MENTPSIGMAKASQSHQVIIANLIHGLKDSLDSNYIAIPEPNYDDGDKNSKQPDVLIIDKDQEDVWVSIEVCLRRMVKSDIQKCQQALKDYPQLQECFVISYTPIGTYEYDTISYTKVTREAVTDEEYSDLLDITFSDILE